MITGISNSTYLKWAALGGLIGAILMGLVMMGATASMGLGYTAMLCAMAIAILGLNPAGGMATTIPGLMLHLIDGIIIGVIVVAITLGVKRKLLITNTKNGLGVGLLAGFLVWLVFGLPILVFAMPPAMSQVAAMMMPVKAGMTMAQADAQAMMMLQGMMGELAGVFLVGHLVWGAALGTIVGFGVSRRGATSKQGYKCNTCGASFNSQEELMSHGKMHMKGGQQLKCDACGSRFASQTDLMEHAKKAHPMPPPK